MIQFNIYWICLDPSVGAEMKKTRPCVIISPNEMNKYLKTITVIPITSKFFNIPTRVRISASKQSGLSEESYAALDQLTTVDKSRLGNRCGKLNEEEIANIRDTLFQMFG